MRCIKLWLISLSFILSACGGGSTSVAGNNSGLPVAVEASTGVFLDSPVINIAYTDATGSNMGVTNASGEFDYFSDETMFFSIGDLDFPAVNAAEIITPMDMAQTLNTTNSKVTNIVRLLMTLDKDGIPGNGITITDTAKAVATQVDFFLSEAEFAASSAVTNLIFNGGQDTVVPGLVSRDAAISHFEAQLAMNDIEFGTIDQASDQEIRDYLADNNLEATLHESGLYYQIVIEGTGESPTSSSTVEVRYTGTLLDGSEFDGTSGTATATLSLSDTISGWQIALPLLKSDGGKGIFYIPSSLGYGETGSGGNIPADAVLIFEIELVSF